MAKTQIDTARLFAVLEARTTDENLSWRQAATQIGVSPSLLSRLRYGQRPDLDGYASIVRWLRMSADDFIEVAGEDAGPGGEVSLITEISALLRRRRDLSDTDKTYLEDVMRVSLDHIRRSQPTQEVDNSASSASGDDSLDIN
ncbi:transcriptional regulator [Diaminobutyricibacter tongyongensis]|uniref:Transcriptional regulator n=1 Tax=Leifsonia tongyongensis TaxID=1268043 RepID=A0A6L9Y2M0_9MICO|nr:transcriptional regulator [Diaminobutyricibacter tongyongensis]NEN07657.1 transcriptional regulator [Diaminobutyricibacter tongyongensis]